MQISSLKLTRQNSIIEFEAPHVALAAINPSKFNQHSIAEGHDWARQLVTAEERNRFVFASQPHGNLPIDRILIQFYAFHRSPQWYLHSSTPCDCRLMRNRWTTIEFARWPWPWIHSDKRWWVGREGDMMDSKSFRRDSAMRKCSNCNLKFQLKIKN